ncbi:MAG: GNAT family N-acetyltransferase [Ilumatobacteraceae bacterium]
MADNVASGRNEVFLGQIGTLPSCRSTGAGRALLAAALAAWKAAGIDAASLGVDSENGTGALGLYERAGFAVTKRSSSWARQLGALTASDAT